jgi:hypothetical protein
MKAFDKVPHRRLLHKMHRYKISEKVIKWVESFLSNSSVLSPFLNSAVMFPSFHSLGTKPWHIDELNIVVIGFDIVALSSFSILG